MAKSKDDAQSMKSMKSKSSTKTTASLLVKQAKSGLATLKHKATEVLSPMKKKAHVPEDAETQVHEQTLNISSADVSSKKTAPK